MRPDRRFAPPAGERGAALLTVLLLVAILSVVTAVALERLTLASRMTRNLVSADQGRAYLLAAEQAAAIQLGDLIKARADRTTLAGGWLGTPQIVPLPGGQAIARVRDAGNCFNLNSVVKSAGTGSAALASMLAARAGESPAAGDGGRYSGRPEGIAQFSALMRLLGIERAVADQIAVSTADWIDTDDAPGPGGAEDSYYSRIDPPYLTAGGLIADPSELRVINGVSADVYQRVRPWICALPVTDLSPINVNTLLPDQAVLLAMLAPDALRIEEARQVLALRPADGYGSLVAFWGQPALARAGLTEAVTEQVRVTSRWLEVALSIDLGGDEMSETVLYDAGQSPARLIRRVRGEGS